MLSIPSTFITKPFGAFIGTFISASVSPFVIFAVCSFCSFGLPGRALAVQADTPSVTSEDIVADEDRAQAADEGKIQATDVDGIQTTGEGRAQAADVDGIQTTGEDRVQAADSSSSAGGYTQWKPNKLVAAGSSADDVDNKSNGSPGSNSPVDKASRNNSSANNASANSASANSASAKGSSGASGGSGTTSGDQSLAPIRLVKKGMKAFLRAQDFGPMISTDRNSVTPHPNAVPLGYIQFEGGTTMDLFNRGGDIILPETFVRLGAWHEGELRFQVPNYITSSGSNGNFRGYSDIQVSIKQDVEPHFLNKRGIDIGVIAGMSLPTGSPELTTNKVDPFVQMIGFYRRGNYTMGTSHSIFMPTELPDDQAISVSPDRNLSYQPTAILFRHFKVGQKKEERADVWIEYAGLYSENSPAVQVIDMGAVWRPLKRHQVDFRFGVGMGRSSPRTFIGFGYSWLPGKIIPFYKRAPEHTYRP